MNKIKKTILLNVPYLFIFYVVNKLSQTYSLTTGADIGQKLITTMDYADNIILSYPFPSFAKTDILTGLFSVILFKVFLYFKSKNAKKFRKGIEYGSARWSA